MLGTGQLVPEEGPQSPQNIHGDREDPLDLDQILGRTWDRYGDASSSQDLSQQSNDEEDSGNEMQESSE